MSALSTYTEFSYCAVMSNTCGIFASIVNVELLLFYYGYNLPINDWRKAEYHVSAEKKWTGVDFKVDL